MFKTYPSIENHYREAHINRFIKRYGDELVNAKYIAEEKLHGSNVQLIFKKNDIGLPVIASRNRIVPEGESFFGVREVIKNTDFSWVYRIFSVSNVVTTIHLYGELIGPGVQKGVDYGSEKSFRIFNMLMNERLLTGKEFYSIFYAHGGTSENLVPLYDVLNSLQEALDVDTRFNSLITNKENNICEGVVIKPFETNFFDFNGSIFYLKKKNEEFKEKQRTRKEPVVCSDEVCFWRNEFLKYLNEERVEGIFSKYGPITDKSQVGQYIGHVMRDAKETFLKEEPNFNKNNFTTKELKHIFGNTNEVPKMLMREL